MELRKQHHKQAKVKFWLEYKHLNDEMGFDFV